MKVYNLAGQRETNITVSKADGSGKIWSLTGVESWVTLATYWVTWTDLRPVKAASPALCFRLHFPLCAVQPLCLSPGS